MREKARFFNVHSGGSVLYKGRFAWRFRRVPSRERHSQLVRTRTRELVEQGQARPTFSPMFAARFDTMSAPRAYRAYSPVQWGMPRRAQAHLQALSCKPLGDTLYSAPHNATHSRAHRTSWTLHIKPTRPAWPCQALPRRGLGTVCTPRRPRGAASRCLAQFNFFARGSSSNGADAES